MDHIILADKSETVEIKTGELAKLFGRGNPEMIHKAIQDLRMKHNGKFDASNFF
jgi:hypothetical protein